MKSTGILMVAEMVRQTLSGHKRHTRRLRGLEKLNASLDRDQIAKVECRDGLWCFWKIGHGSSALPVFTAKCPYGQTGDRLWVRETWGPCEGGFCYAASEQPEVKPDGGKWRPSIHMPRLASRITLELVSVRVERVQDISEEDAKAEGVEPYAPNDGRYVQGFHELWDSINADRGFGWSVNPWVWVLAFKEVER